MLSFYSISNVSIARPLRAGVALLALVLAAGCTYTNGDRPDLVKPVCDTSAVTYSKIVSPIFDANCRECHATNKASVLGGGNDFGTYQAIKRYPAAALLGSIEQAPGYDPMPKGRARISDCDIERIRAWMAAGEPEN